MAFIGQPWRESTGSALGAPKSCCTSGVCAGSHRTSSCCRHSYIFRMGEKKIKSKYFIQLAWFQFLSWIFDHSFGQARGPVTAAEHWGWTRPAGNTAEKRHSLLRLSSTNWKGGRWSNFSHNHNCVLIISWKESNCPIIRQCITLSKAALWRFMYFKLLWHSQGSSVYTFVSTSSTNNSTMTKAIN